MTYEEADELFITQAAHLLLALADIKPLPRSKAESPNQLIPPDSGGHISPHLPCQ